MRKWLPTPQEVVKGAITVLAAGALSALILAKFPALQKWVR